MKKYAMLLMNPHFDVQKIRLDADGIEHHLICVRSFEEAMQIVITLKEEGFGAIELCGAFGEEFAYQLFEACDKQIPVGYITYPQHQETMINQFWKQDV